MADLHSTMYLLSLGIFIYKVKTTDDLHSTMYLLSQMAVGLYVR